MSSTGPSREFLEKLGLVPTLDNGITPTLPESPTGHPIEMKPDIFENVMITKPKCLAGCFTIEVHKGHSVRILSDGVLLFSNNSVLDFNIVLYDVSTSTCAAIVTFAVPGHGIVQMQMQHRIAVMCVLAEELMHFGNHFPLWYVLVHDYFRKIGGVADEVKEKSKKLLTMELKRQAEVESRPQKSLNSNSLFQEPKRCNRKRVARRGTCR